MENYDLSTISRDKLYFLLSTAKDEIMKYTRCREEIQRMEENIKKEKSEMGCGAIWSIAILGFCVFLFIYLVLSVFHIDYWPVNALVFVLVVIACAMLLFSSRSAAPKKIKEYEAQLLDLEKREKETFARFYTIVKQYEFPKDYWYEYALTMMLKFLERKQANTWKEIVDLYEEHLFRLENLDKNQQILNEIKWQSDEIKRQSDDIRRGRKAAEWAAILASLK